ncbi:MAG: hypothetical protein OWR52_09825 [Acidibacillus sp.]|uniref:Uncharacterized protein n=1 Tax=Sulfoacidibacillus ferrooxidans TaxID=2005001 RepID=A0A9X1V9N2_9BACL|nr:hypothetical protein [Sulfoacidibacillus ferrooxidans]MCI0183260.1 hypothetical protein [Sulfoacidibacillus ferrooxidans]MCY0893792.1 hypothetical protein [Acidibacillus sp.]
MERGIKNWMLASMAILLAEVGRIIGAEFHIHRVEQVIDGIAIVIFLVAAVRFIVDKRKR